VEQTQFRFRKSDGSLARTELSGALLTTSDPASEGVTFRIDQPGEKKLPRHRDIVLYSFSAKDPRSGAWVNFCEPTPRASGKVFPLSGYWTSRAITTVRTPAFP